jgi:hypothetical protein
MADRKYSERVEHLAGTGHVYDGLDSISKVRYNIEVWQEKIESGTFSGTSIINGLKKVRGTIDPIDKSIMELFGKTLTLVFEDGRKMDFFVTNANTGSVASSSEIH